MNSYIEALTGKVVQKLNDYSKPETILALQQIKVLQEISDSLKRIANVVDPQKTDTQE